MSGLKREVTWDEYEAFMVDRADDETRERVRAAIQNERTDICGFLAGLRTSSGSSLGMALEAAKRRRKVSGQDTPQDQS